MGLASVCQAISSSANLRAHAVVMKKLTQRRGGSADAGSFQAADQSAGLSTAMSQGATASVVP